MQGHGYLGRDKLAEARVDQRPVTQRGGREPDRGARVHALLRVSAEGRGRLGAHGMQQNSLELRGLWQEVREQGAERDAVAEHARSVFDRDLAKGIAERLSVLRWPGHSDSSLALNRALDAESGGEHIAGGKIRLNASRA
jgi:hypothetical protein